MVKRLDSVKATPISSVHIVSGAILETDLNFCQRCGHGLVVEPVHGQPRPRCSTCGFIVFLEPKLAAVVLVSMEDKLVLVRRANEPALGEWSFPSGYVDRGEAVEDAAVREVREETGLQVELNRLLGGVTIASGGVLPNINAVLLPKKGHDE